ncbi:hypothetical protein [Gracilinema caldarium]|uniref:hypothetical protein n=1 Tax=Gracilinema caldarium TaxID=215591 RepID=UPI0026F23A53|nr:hypothetical protein [Gracilinema caldarium]
MNYLRFSGILAILMIAVSSCTTLDTGYKTPIGMELTIAGGLKGVIVSMSPNRTYITYNGKTFRPLNSNLLIAEIVMEISNESDAPIPYSELSSLELMTMDQHDQFAFATWSRPFDSDERIDLKSLNDLKPKMVPTGETTKEIFYFTYPKEAKPVGLSSKRKEFINFMDETNLHYEAVNKQMERSKVLESLTLLSSYLPYPEIKTVMDINNISLEEKNFNGLTLLYIGILSHNDSVLLGALNDGADFNSPAQYSIFKILPIHAAVLSTNKTAIDTFLARGCSLTESSVDSDSPAALAVRVNNPRAVQFLIDNYGIDYRNIKLKMNWSPAISAYKFAKMNNMQEIVHILEIQESSH